jgi:hypothetical protein
MPIFPGGDRIKKACNNFIKRLRIKLNGHFITGSLLLL